MTLNPFIIPVFLPHAGCPHQCAFCNQKAITQVHSSHLSESLVLSQITQFLAYKGPNPRDVQISFYGGNFLGLSETDVLKCLHLANRFVKSGQVNTLRFSTRPDTITPQRLSWLKNFPVSTVELGAQSMNDKVLSKARRGHTAHDTKNAIYLLKTAGYKIGLQMMAGLPGEDLQSFLESARRMACLCPDFVRIYPTLVLEKSLLSKWYESGRYKPLSLDEAVNHVKQAYLVFHEKNITVIRMGLQASSDLDQGSVIKAGPYHPAFGHLVYSAVFLDKAIDLIKQNNKNTEIILAVHPRSISKIRGLKNSNVEILTNMFNIESLKIISCPEISEDEIVQMHTF